MLNHGKVTLAQCRKLCNFSVAYILRETNFEIVAFDTIKFAEIDLT